MMMRSELRGTMSAPGLGRVMSRKAHSE